MGCDLSATVCRSVSESLGIAMHHGAIHTVARTGGFRAVVANHVLEHTDDPVAFLSAARDLLDPCGVLHLAVPNIGAWEARLSGWTSYEPYHMLYFDKRSLVRTVERSGLRIRRVETREPFSGWFLAVLRTILSFNRGGDFSAPKSLWRRAVRRRPLVVEHTYRVAALAAGTALWPLRVLQGRLGYGEELICLATK
jgi:SAM-dependent methyltransferase